MTRPNPLLVLQARTEARAILFEAGAIPTLGEALDPLYHYALHAGIVDERGADAAWHMIGHPFRNIRLS